MEVREPLKHLPHDVARIIDELFHGLNPRFCRDFLASKGRVAGVVVEERDHTIRLAWWQSRAAALRIKLITNSLPGSIDPKNEAGRK